MTHGTEAQSSKTAKPDYGLDQETLRLIRGVVRDDREIHHAESEQPMKGDRSTKSARAGRRSLLALDLSMITPRHIAILVIIAAVFIKPWFLPTVFLWAALVFAFVLLVFGRDRCRRALAWLWKGYAARRPEKAEYFRKRINKRQSRIQSFLDKLPFTNIGGPNLPHWQSQDSEVAAEHAYARRMAKIRHDEHKNPYAG